MSHRHEKNSAYLESPNSHVTLVAYLFISVLLMSIDRQGHYLDGIHNFGQQLAEPVYLVFDAPRKTGHWLGDYLATRTELHQKLTRQHEQILKLTAENKQTLALMDENARLRALMGGQQSLKSNYELTEILNVRLEPGLQALIIDKGTADGVSEGQVVVDGNGVVGQVIRPAKHTSFVMLITDPNHGIPVIISRTGLHGIAYGTGNPQILTMPNTPVTADVKAGDLIVASGYGQRFPAGYPVGKVTGLLRPEGSIFTIIEVKPLSSLSESTHLLLVENSEVQ